MTTTYDGPGTLERVPPNSITAEQAVLGGMMLSKSAILDAVELLGDLSDAFYRPAHDAIFTAIVTQYANGEPVDPLTLSSAMHQRGDLDRVGGASYLHTCVQAVPTAANTGYYATIVRNFALLRRIIETGTDLVQTGYEGRADHENAAAILDEAAAKLQALTASLAAKSDSREWTLDRVVGDVIDDYDNPRNDRLPLPWKDAEAGVPIEPGDFVVIAGRPGMGKTNVLLEIGRHVAIRHNRGVLVASMEMSHRQNGQRILAAEAKIPLHWLRERQLEPHHRAELDAAAGRILGAPLRIDDRPSRTVSHWRSRLRQLQADGKLPALLIVDYLQIAKAEAAAHSNRTVEVDSIAVGLKALAQEFQIAVIAAAQLNRAVEQRTDKRPTMSDLRESGGIENNANIVILLHREDYYDRESSRSGEFDLIVAKNRQGHTFTSTLAWRGGQARVVDMAAN